MDRHIKYQKAQIQTPRAAFYSKLTTEKINNKERKEGGKDRKKERKSRDHFKPNCQPAVARWSPWCDVASLNRLFSLPPSCSGHFFRSTCHNEPFTDVMLLWYSWSDSHAVAPPPTAVAYCPPLAPSGTALTGEPPSETCSHHRHLDCVVVWSLASPDQDSCSISEPIGAHQSKSFPTQLD